MTNPAMFRPLLTLMRRPLLKGLSLATLLALPLPALAECVGQNLFDALPAAEQQTLTTAAHQQPYAQGLLFEARKGDRHVTVVGTYHLGDDRHQATLDRLAPALDGAKMLLVEAGPEEERQLKEAMGRDPSLAFIVEGATLPERLAEADWQRLRQAMSDRGMPAPMAAKMRPWFVTVTLALSPCAMAEAKQGIEGLDRQVIDMAKDRGLPVRALEPFDTAFKIFNGLSADEEHDMILTALSTESRADDYMQTLADLYFRGEPRLIWEFSRADAILNAGLTPAEVDHQMALTEERLMTTRNRAWMAGIEDAATQGPAIVAVGALHLSGKDGVLRLLEQNGWTINRLDS